MPAIKVSAIPAFQDNYIWLIHTGGNECAVVDPGDAEPVRQALQLSGLNLAYILITHHHADHIGGVNSLVKEFNPHVIGPVDARIKGLDTVVRQGDKACLPQLGLEFEVIECPGHTLSHIAFYGHGSLFCGDTLFSVGCGRLFEGTPEQMQVSLDKFAVLPAETQVYCAHEYTLSNCKFALAVEPGNEKLQKKTRQVQAAREHGEITIPSTLQEELAVNPFLRSRVESVIQAARQRDPTAEPGAGTLRAIRDWKDNW
jgi:hydroxyacylglutathione hydrolase